MENGKNSLFLRNINKYNLIDTYRILHLTAEYAFSSCVHGTFIKVDHILGVNVLTYLKEFTGHDFEQTLRDSEGQGSLACCRPWGRKQSDITERLNNNHKEFKPYEVFSLTTMELN